MTMSKPEQSKLTFVALIILWAIYLLIIPGCATQRKAEKFYKKHPVELAKVCAEKYPVKDSIIKGDSVVIYDTLWGLETRVDTLTVEPQVITKTIEKTVPKLVTKVVTVHDTIVRENTAKTAVLSSQIAKLELDKKELTVKLQLANDATKHATSQKNKYLWLLIAMTIFAFRKQIIAVLSKLIRK